ncbi:MAG TPA: hypothetical protein VM285_10340, partial [Polyangia bacterium]|nr:hypothetical protein [Polyangia bacterium]
RGGESCPKCGLVFALFDPSRLDADVPAALRQLWTHVEAGWEDQARHALFVEQALAAGHGGFAAARYRQKSDDPVARQQLERITSRLEQLLATAATPPDERPEAKGRKVIWLLVLLLAAAFAALILASFSR